MQEHRKQASKVSKSGGQLEMHHAHFEGILNFKRGSINVIDRRMYCIYVLEIVNRS
jgi:hypothetical protein